MKRCICFLMIFASSASFAQYPIDLCFDANLYLNPEFNSIILLKIPAGERVLASSMTMAPNEWDKYFLVSYNGEKGWIYKNDVVYNDNYYAVIKDLKAINDIDSSKIIPRKNDPIYTQPNTVNNAKPIPKPDFKTTMSNPYTTKTINLIKSNSGTYTIPCKVNGLKLNFVFDTGASDVSISLTEALFMLKNGYLDEKDIFGTEYYRIASGDIEEGTKIILKELEFDGLRLFNVEASIVHNLDAPLLLGQSAISILGKIQIDFSKNTLSILK